MPKCQNPTCDRGYVIITRLLSKPQEIWAMAKAFPDKPFTPHTREESAPCQFCNPESWHFWRKHEKRIEDATPESKGWA